MESPTISPTSAPGAAGGGNDGGEEDMTFLTTTFTADSYQHSALLLLDYERVFDRERRLSTGRDGAVLGGELSSGDGGRDVRSDSAQACDSVLRLGTTKRSSRVCFSSFTGFPGHSGSLTASSTGRETLNVNIVPVLVCEAVTAGRLSGVSLRNPLASPSMPA